MEIIEEDLPIHPVAREVAAEFGDSAVDYALFGGEDYELLFTIPREAFDTLQAREVTVALPAVSVIGRILDAEEGLTLVSRTGTRRCFLPEDGTISPIDLLHSTRHSSLYLSKPYPSLVEHCILFLTFLLMILRFLTQLAFGG
jgi:hypothetical protein